LVDLTNYRGKKVLITGAGGFIGSHLTEACARLGATVTAMTRYNSSSSHAMLKYADREVMGAVSILPGNIEDSEFVSSAMAGQDVVFHLAALIAIPYSYIAPRSYIRTNVEGTLNVIEAARRTGTRVVHTSTSEVYGTALRVPIDENHPLQGQSPYSASKIAADKLVESYVLSFGLDAVTARPFNTFGPRQSARAFIPTVILQALTSDVVELGALDPLRDMTYVADTVEGFLHAGIAENVAGETINFGTGETHSIGAVARRILEQGGAASPVGE
jgi:nucleoside-diphosphate-sugar epimerase